MIRGQSITLDALPWKLGLKIETGPALNGVLAQDAALQDLHCSTVQRRRESQSVGHLVLAMCFPSGLQVSIFPLLKLPNNLSFLNTVCCVSPSDKSICYGLYLLLNRDGEERKSFSRSLS